MRPCNHCLVTKGRRASISATGGGGRAAEPNGKMSSTFAAPTPRPLAGITTCFTPLTAVRAMQELPRAPQVRLPRPLQMGCDRLQPQGGSPRARCTGGQRRRVHQPGLLGLLHQRQHRRAAHPSRHATIQRGCRERHLAGRQGRKGRSPLRRESTWPGGICLHSWAGPPRR